LGNDEYDNFYLRLAGNSNNCKSSFNDSYVYGNIGGMFLWQI